jgi:hypothetical protein
MPAEKSRRPRVVQACNFCRTKKYKCDGHIPCIHCRSKSSARKIPLFLRPDVADNFFWKGYGVECIYKAELGSAGGDTAGYSVRYFARDIYTIVIY